MWLWWDPGEFYFLCTWWNFFRFPTKNMYCLCNLKGKKNQHGVIKSRVVKWMIVCQKKFTSFPVSSMWVHATKWVRCSLLISRDQLSVIAHLKSKYQREAETGELYLMEQHLRKSFGRWEEGRVSSYRDVVAYLMGDSELPIATMCQHRLSGLWALSLILGPASEKISINLGVCLRELQNWSKAGKQALWIKDKVAEFISLRYGKPS